MTTSLAAALSALELGHLEPRAEDVLGMCPPSTEALEQTTTAIWSDLFATLQNTSLERDIEEMGWGLVNLFHRAAAKKHATIDRLTDEIRLLLAEQDGSEINTANLEDKIDLAKKIEEAATCYEHMRDIAAAHYIRETGRSWIPSTGNRISLGVTSAIVDGRAFLHA
ncbi:MAG: chromosome segregation ATPase, partial [Sphingomonas sp.]